MKGPTSMTETMTETKPKISDPKIDELKSQLRKMRRIARAIDSMDKPEQEWALAYLKKALGGA